MNSLMDILNAGAPPARMGAVIPDGTASAAPVAPLPAAAPRQPGFFDTLTPSGPPPIAAPMAAPQSAGSSRFALIAKQLAPIIGSLVLSKKAGAPAASAFLGGYLETKANEERELERQALVDQQAQEKLTALNDAKSKELSSWLQNLPVDAAKLSDPAAFASFAEIADTVGVTRYKLPKGTIKDMLSAQGPAVDKSDVKEASDLIKTIGPENLQRGLDAGAVVQFRGKQVPLREVYALSGMPTDAKGAPVYQGPQPKDEPVTEGRFISQALKDAEAKKGSALTSEESRKVTLTARKEWADSARNDDPILNAMRELRLIQLRQSGSGANMTPSQLRMADSLADNFARDSKDFAQRAQSFSTLLAASGDPSPAGDMSLIFAFMKMLDPGSVVREGEYATAQNAAGVPDQIKNIWNKVIKGERLNPKQRADFLNKARSNYQSAQRRQEGVVTTYTQRAKRAGVPAEMVVMDYGAGVEAPTTAPARVRVKLANGQTGTMDANEPLPAGAVIIK